MATSPVCTFDIGITFYVECAYVEGICNRLRRGLVLYCMYKVIEYWNLARTVYERSDMKCPYMKCALKDYE